ncbi:MAG: MBL fold metallo-hydrolase [Rhodospirillaceae bacterium]|nr:MBL fold metallo-hydrolase [Rhodospirillaceae bacterium]
MKITVLGCGPSVGVPMLGNRWGSCDPTNSKNRRRRCSILVENQGFTLLIDTTPDLREQLLDAQVSRIDAVLFTHAHADHTHGLDDLRPMFWLLDEQINVYGDAKTLEELDNRFDYMFRKSPDSPPYFRSPLVANEIGMEPFELGGMKIQPVRQDHGVSGESLGFIFKGLFAYSTDVAYMSNVELERLSGIELWIVDCLRISSSRAHSVLGRTLSWIKVVQPKQAYLTHMSSEIDYDTVMAQLPDTVQLAYDGMTLRI